jgi:hypothetical protein
MTPILFFLPSRGGGTCLLSSVGAIVGFAIDHFIRAVGDEVSADVCWWRGCEDARRLCMHGRAISRCGGAWYCLVFPIVCRKAWAAPPRVITISTSMSIHQLTVLDSSKYPAKETVSEDEITDITDLRVGCHIHGRTTPKMARQTVNQWLRRNAKIESRHFQNRYPS